MTITAHFHYPGDPVFPVVLQSGREFLASQPRPREVIVRTCDAEHRWDVGNDIVCDSCNAEIGPDDRLAFTMNRVYCPTCTAQWITPYLVEIR